jgi:hypothetical protein
MVYGAKGMVEIFDHVCNFAYITIELLVLLTTLGAKLPDPLQFV